MDIVVKGRNVEVPDHYRVHVDEKLMRLERYDRKTIRADVELFHERNPRQAKNCQRVEITLKGRGPAVRAEAAAADFYAALDSAAAKLETRLSRAHDRRKISHGRRKPTSVAEATAHQGDHSTVAMHGTNPQGGTAVLESVQQATRTDTGELPEQRWSDDGQGPGRIVREKEHSTTPMTVDQALYEMELVGHDFYLFADADSGRPSVVYRRKGFDYGVIRLAD